MYVSMTGFGRSQIQAPWGALSLEVSSVNHRYQEIFVRLPREFVSWEPWFHQKLRKLFRRGKVQLRMEVLWSPTFKMGRINKEILSSYCDELLQIQRSMGQARELELEKVVSLPGVLDLPRFEDSEDAETLDKIFEKLLDTTVASWQEMRALEGSHLREEILTHLAELERLTTEIEARWLPTRDSAFEALRTRISDTLEGLGERLDEGRFLQEIAILTDKWDVSEELARLKSHIIKFRATGMTPNLRDASSTL